MIAWDMLAQHAQALGMQKGSSGALASVSNRRYTDRAHAAQLELSSSSCNAALDSKVQCRQRYSLHCWIAYLDSSFLKVCLLQQYAVSASQEDELASSQVWGGHGAKGDVAS